MPQTVQAAVFSLAVLGDFGGDLGGSEALVDGFVPVDFPPGVGKHRFFSPLTQASLYSRSTWASFGVNGIVRMPARDLQQPPYPKGLHRSVRPPLVERGLTNRCAPQHSEPSGVRRIDKVIFTA
jgi:hypothetical protein